MKYRKKPVTIEAVEFTGTNYDECIEFCENSYCPDSREVGYRDESLIIKTLEGEMLCNVGDFIIKGVEGEFYPCKPSVFDKTYVALSNQKEKS